MLIQRCVNDSHFDLRRSLAHDFNEVYHIRGTFSDRNSLLQPARELVSTKTIREDPSVAQHNSPKWQLAHQNYSCHAL